MNRRKTILIILIFMLSCSFVFCVTQHNMDFYIYAYKAGSENSSESFANLEITDAVVAEIGMISDGREIDLTTALDQLLGTIDDSGSDYTQRSVFSYRVTGNTVGKYSVRISFEKPFYKDGEINASNPDTNRVDFSYSLGSIAYSFNDYKNHSGMAFTDEDTGKSYTITSIGGIKNGAFSSLANDDVGEELVEAWTFNISEENDTIMDFDYWIARGVVGLSISSDDYREAETGKYQTNVKVTLTYDENSGGSRI